jgi:hypothetical protein
MQGGLNFFEVPFPSKVIFRMPLDSWPVAGSHTISGMNPDKEFKINDEQTFVAHIPFLTFDRLEIRARHGKELAAAGYSRAHGWQSQVVSHMQTQGRLNEYWMRVSIPSRAPSHEFGAPQTITDNRLAPVVESAVDEFLPTLEAMDTNASIQIANSEPAITLTQGIQAVRAMSIHKQQGIDFANLRIMEANLHIGKLDNHIKNLQTQLQTQAEYFAAEQSELLNSISWRATKLLRSGHSWIRKALLWKSSGSK